MILIADNGRRKTDWRILSRTGEVRQVYTVAIDPQYQDARHLADMVAAALRPHVAFEEAPVIKYYSAGNSSVERNSLVEEVLQQVFPGSEVLADHDLLMLAKLQQLTPETLQQYLISA
ncbi:hypothetical protein FVR03_16985 [Pontibacter qinzhouensis]|uniref:Uncharacterized protein n=1 Tax=Pontibacter qinzhouensis TaxID=2603253 RepID=A0A5C8JH31_9BACT|nr:hypothetical protein [Pontibacter qinzhouensis]TXK36712.1 hypothetical protein FVR03_16985 [Pontibacter qinzhouensis]